MLDIPVREVMERRNILTATPQTVVARAVHLMAERNVGAVMIVVDDRLVGIFTERDVVFRVVARRLDVDSTCVGDVMTPAPRTVGPEEPLGVALITMHENGFRHLPVLEEGRLVGVVSARSAMDPELEEFTAEATRRRYFARMR